MMTTSSRLNNNYSFHMKRHIPGCFTTSSIPKTTDMNMHDYICNELGGNMARFTEFPIMITWSTIIYEIISPGAAGSSIYV